jgi:metal-sulfur cluster biosynthetic enzyme
MIDRHEIVRRLRQVIDPELGVNLVDLGLVYNIMIDADKVIVEYTATTPGCPMRRFLQKQVEEALAETEGVGQYEARLIWEPVWNVDMIVPGVDFFAYPLPRLTEYQDK